MLLRWLTRDRDVEPAELRARRLTSQLEASEYSVSFTAAGHTVTMPVPGDDEADALRTFQVWLETTDNAEIGDGTWRVVDANFRGQHVLFQFRTNWVTGFWVTKKEVGRRERRRVV